MHKEAICASQKLGHYRNFYRQWPKRGVLSNITYRELANVNNLGSDTFCITVFHHKQARAGPIRVILSLGQVFSIKSIF